MNAVVDALTDLGIRHLDMPATPQRGGGRSRTHPCRWRRNKGRGGKQHVRIRVSSPDVAKRGSRSSVRQRRREDHCGGQTLIPTLKQRLAQPSDVIDLGSIAELRGIREEGGGLVIGATTRHAEVAGSEVVRRVIPVLAELANGIGDAQVRNGARWAVDLQQRPVGGLSGCTGRAGSDGPNQ